LAFLKKANPILNQSIRDGHQIQSGH